MNLHININGHDKAPGALSEFVRQVDSMLASIDGVHDWSIRTDSSEWVWTEDGGYWNKI